MLHLRGPKPGSSESYLLLVANSLGLGDSIDSLLELLTDLEEWKLLWWNRDLLSGLRITTFVRTVLLNHKAAEPANLDATTVYERISHLAVNEVNNLFCLHDVDLTTLR